MDGADKTHLCWDYDSGWSVFYYDRYKEDLKMKRILVVGLLIFGVLFFISRISASSKDVLGMPAPDFKLQDLNYNTINLQEFKDKEQPVLIFFWTTWCPFCQREIRVLRDSYGSLVKAGVEVLAIDVGESYNKVTSLVGRYQLPFRVLLDKDSHTAETYSIRGVPTYILVNKRGEIVFWDNEFPSGYKELLAQ